MSLVKSQGPMAFSFRYRELFPRWLPSAWPMKPVSPFFLDISIGSLGDEKWFVLRNGSFLPGFLLTPSLFCEAINASMPLRSTIVTSIM